MRHLAFILLAVGLLVGAAGSVMGWGALFSWNGRHPIAVHPLKLGEPLHATIDTCAGCRYTVATQVVFDREGLVEEDGALVVEAKLPLVATLYDAAGTAVIKTTGWLDPHEPPSVLYGQVHGTENRHAPGDAPPELLVERLLGPWPAAGRQTISFDVNLGTDRVGTAKITQARAVVFDDVFPPSMKFGFALSVVGTLSFLAGGALLMLRGLRKFLSRRGSIRRRQSV